MRLRTIILLAALALLVFQLRDHICEVGEVLRTYTTFHSLISRHPDLLYRHGREDPLYPEATPASNATIPKIIHNIALGENVNFAKYAAAMQSCLDLHPGWTHMLWTDKNATDFVTENYPSILTHYAGYPQLVQRADTLRYALLHKLGGVYMDLDVTCRVALDSTQIMNLPFVTPGAHPAGINNAFMAAQPGHEFLRVLLDSIPQHDLYWGLPMRIPYVETMMNTGCMFLSNQWVSYVHQMLAGKRFERVFILANEDGDIKPHMLRGKTTTPLFVHGGSSSWHSWDATLFLVIGKHYILFAALLVTLVVLLVGAMLGLCASNSRPYKRGGIFSWLRWSMRKSFAKQMKTESDFFA